MIQALRDEYLVNISQAETVIGTGDKDKRTTVEQGGDDTPKVERKLKPKLRKKVKDDFFASDDEDQKMKQHIVSKKAVTNAKRVKPSSDSDGEKGPESKRIRN